MWVFLAPRFYEDVYRASVCLSLCMYVVCCVCVCHVCLLVYLLRTRMCIDVCLYVFMCKITRIFFSYLSQRCMLLIRKGVRNESEHEKRRKDRRKIEKKKREQKVSSWLRESSRSRLDLRVTICHMIIIIYSFFSSFRM